MLEFPQRELFGSRFLFLSFFIGPFRNPLRGERDSFTEQWTATFIIDHLQNAGYNLDKYARNNYTVLILDQQSRDNFLNGAVFTIERMKKGRMEAIQNFFFIDEWKYKKLH
jgi:hypothetical protein